MPSQKNQDQVKTLKEKLQKAKSLVLADFKGLSVEKQQKLSQEIKKAGGVLTVTKNRLLSLALKDQNFPLASPLKNSTIALFSFEDEVSALKVLYQFIKENEIPKIKFGFLNHDLMEKEKIEALAQLPSKLELRAQVVGTLASPLSGIVYVLKGNLSKLVMTLEEIKKEKSKTPSEAAQSQKTVATEIMEKKN